MPGHVFLDHDQLKYVRGLRGEGRLHEAEKMLLKAVPSPAVLDELRKIASTRAREAKKIGNWADVVKHLEGYNRLAEKWRGFIADNVNAEPPEHTKTDRKLLAEAKEKLSQ